MFSCLECGKKFKTVKAAERASDNGCPRCGGVDIDLDVSTPAGNVPARVEPKPSDGPLWTGFPTKAELDAEKGNS